MCSITYFEFLFLLLHKNSRKETSIRWNQGILLNFIKLIANFIMFLRSLFANVIQIFISQAKKLKILIRFAARSLQSFGSSRVSYTRFFFFFFTGDSSRCIEFERSRQKIREGIRNRIYSRTIILPVIARHSSKEIAILRNSTKDMSQVPLIAAEETSTTESPTCNMVILEVKKEKQEKRERKKYIRVLQFFYFVTSLICYLFTFFLQFFYFYQNFIHDFISPIFFSSFINQFISFKNIQRLKKYFHLIF